MACLDYGYPSVVTHEDGQSMRIEHVAFQVREPQAVARWYGEHLGMTIRRASTQGTQMHFLACDQDHVLLEFYYNPVAPLPDYASMHPLILHIAWESQDIPADAARLTQAGATVAQEMVTTPDGDRVMMLRDPWGLALQLVQRRQPML
jgi:glyoxylase I family protein